MESAEYSQFTSETEQTHGKTDAQKWDIMTFGLASEIAFLTSAIKNKLRWDRSPDDWDKPNGEILEELGDVLWYCFSLWRLARPPGAGDILIAGIDSLKTGIESGDRRAERARELLGERGFRAFIKAADEVEAGSTLNLDEYQKIAFHTARTAKRQLLDVCLAVLWQLGAQLLRRNLPEAEREINIAVVDAPADEIALDVLWHLSAVASLYNLPLSEVAEKNIDKLSYRLNVSHPTPLHDEDAPEHQRFPRKFEISFVTVGHRRSRMYYSGRQLGDELTDNSYEEDGYRFHDVMHLAHIAILGWSPVVRGLMGLKRKNSLDIDEVQDGARAKIVEEAIVKVIHSEGVRLARLAGHGQDNVVRLFPDRTAITYRFLTSIREFIQGLEVSHNRYWEWGRAIVEGYKVFHDLRIHGQGTVMLDLEERSLTFRPDVFVDISGSVLGLGTYALEIDGCSEELLNTASLPELDTLQSQAPSSQGETGARAKLVGIKQAVLAALGMQRATEQQLGDLILHVIDGGRISVSAKGELQAFIWNKKVISFRYAIAEAGRVIHTTVVAMGDPKDAKAPS